MAVLRAHSKYESYRSPLLALRRVRHMWIWVLVQINKHLEKRLD